jgi:asparagine synthase (glutamine-hydrolysing)
MCGIAGLYYFDQERQVEQKRLKEMSNSLVHRGPDGRGIYIDKNIGLAHQRLAIIDLETGTQPMKDELTGNHIVFNGEIYNYIELREELRRKGYQFRTESDTEVILLGYREWGAEVQNKLNGMWAFGLWDENEKRLFLSRDRMGEKPLYYANTGKELIFASEIKGIFSSQLLARIPDLSLQDIYLSTGYIPAPYTFFKNIQKLQPGEFLIAKGNVVRTQKYWVLPSIDEGDLLRNKSEIYSEFESLFYDSVKLRMRSDVPFGAFLSGGLDSSCIVAAMSEIADYPIETFTIGFQNKAFDERHLAAAVADKFGTNHHEYIVGPDSFDEALQKVVFHHDEPFGDSSSLPTSYVSRFAQTKVKMVLTGDGGDELLSGYTNYQGEKFAAQLQRFPKILRESIPSLIMTCAAPFSGSIRYKMNRADNVIRSSNMNFMDRLMMKMAWIEPDTKKNLLSGSEQQFFFEEFLGDLYRQYTVKDPFYKLMYFHLLVSLPDDMLTKVDRMSMAHSLETRIPFLDHRLIEFMINVDKNVKLQGYERKSVLRQTLGAKLPQELLRSPKMGFTVPLHEWFKSKTFENTLEDLYETDFGLDQKVIKGIVDENREGVSNNGNFIWMLFVLKSVLEQ